MGRRVCTHFLRLFVQANSFSAKGCSACLKCVLPKIFSPQPRPGAVHIASGFSPAMRAGTGARGATLVYAIVGVCLARVPKMKLNQ